MVFSYLAANFKVALQQIQLRQRVNSLIKLTNISKSFGNNQAVDDVTLELNSGSVHALMGENGAGKSTLMKILAGVHQPDVGSISRAGEVVSLTSPKLALDFGISTVFQELSLLPNLTIAENMFLGREPKRSFGMIDTKLMESQTKAALAELGLTLNPSTLVSELTIAERQFVEIAHGIKADANIFILDEPTAALNAADVGMLNKHIRRMKDEGKAIVYISHRMDEIFDICDTVTVMKDGQHVATKSLSDMTPDSLIAMMVGRELEDLFPERSDAQGACLLEVKHFKLTSVSQPLSLKVHKGEIVALAGLEGQGQREIVRSLIGQHIPFGGTVRVKDHEISLPVAANNGIRQMSALGLGFVPEDRKDEGLFLNLPIADNITIGLHSTEGGLAPARKYREVIADTIKSMAIKTSSANASVASLSGGNQQKVLLGRYFASDVDLLVIEEPTRGVDIGAKAEIYKLLRQFTENGGGVLVLSRETIELIGLCDRILVIHDQTIVSEMVAADATEHNILDAALSSGSDATGSV